MLLLSMVIQLAGAAPIEVACPNTDEGAIQQCALTQDGVTLAAFASAGEPELHAFGGLFSELDGLRLNREVQGDGCPSMYRVVCDNAVSDAFGNCEALGGIAVQDGVATFAFHAQPVASRKAGQWRLDRATCRVSESNMRKKGPTKLQSPNPLPAPLTGEQLTVGTQRTLVVLGTSNGEDRDDAGFRVLVNSFTTLRMPVNEWWLGCQPKARKAVGKSGRRWAVSLSFATRDQADHYVMGKGLSPVAVVDDEIEPCGD